MDFLYFLSAARSNILFERRDSISHGQVDDGRAGSETRGQLRDWERDELKADGATSTGSLEKEVGGGSAERELKR